MTDNELIQKALNALEEYCEHNAILKPIELREELRKRLKQSNKYLEEIITYLWEIIDDIDTFSDMAKYDDKLFRGLVEQRQKDRWQTGITTDGYTLNIPNYPPLNLELKRKFYCLTDEEHVQIAVDCGCLGADWVLYGATVERKLREKNGL